MLPPSFVFILPVELYLQIFYFLDVKDLLALRKTCKHFLMLTQERGLWSMMFVRLRASQALPFSRADFAAMSSSQAERILFTASKVEASFLQLREHIIDHIPAVIPPYASMNASTCSWRVLTFISDRFILSVDSTAVIIWDTSTLPSSSSSSMTVPGTPWAHFTLSNFLGYVDCHSTLYIAIAHIHGDNRSAIVHSVPLPPPGENKIPHGRLHREAEFPMGGTELLKHMDPYLGRALVYSHPTTIHIVHWRDDNRRSTISIESDHFDHQGWNGIITLRFCGPYILCFRVRSVEAYPVPMDTPTAQRLPMLRYQFGSICFRAVALSQVQVSHRPSGDVYTLFMLTNDVYEGMFHYRIRVAATPVPSMSVRVLAKGSIPTPNPLPPLSGTADYTPQVVVRRMFFSTWSLGSAGLRGVWVDRLRGSIDRRVVAFTTHPTRLQTKETHLISGEASALSEDGPDKVHEAPAVDGRVVHVISSYDLRDDITICAVSEWTGRIALGSRVGAISLL